MHGEIGEGVRMVRMVRTAFALCALFSWNGRGLDLYAAKTGVTVLDIAVGTGPVRCVPGLHPG